MTELKERRHEDKETLERRKKVIKSKCLLHE